MIPPKRTDPAVLERRARRQRLLLACMLTVAVATVVGTGLAPLALPQDFVAAWVVLAMVAIAAMVVAALSLIRLRKHHDAANPPDPLEGRARKNIDFDKTWRGSP